MTPYMCIFSVSKVCLIFLLVCSFFSQRRSHCWRIILLSISLHRTFTSLLQEGKMKTSSSCHLFFKAFLMLLHYFWGNLSRLNKWLCAFSWSAILHTVKHIASLQEQCWEDGSPWKLGSHLSVPWWDGWSGVSLRFYSTIFTTDCKSETRVGEAKKKLLGTMRTYCFMMVEQSLSVGLLNIGAYRFESYHRWYLCARCLIKHCPGWYWKRMPMLSRGK